MSMNEVKAGTAAAKDAWSVLGQVTVFVDNVADDFDRGRYARGCCKIAGVCAVVGTIFYCAHSISTSAHQSKLA